jgi:RsiW-degrading membrane proteinase PrsW (M82 family)
VGSNSLRSAAISTIYSYVFSGFLGGITNGEIFRTDPQTVVALAAMWGGVSGFLIAALITAPVFVLSQIEMNTRRTAAMLERLAQPRR